MHKEAVLKIAATKSTSSGIGTQLRDQKHHQNMSMKLLSCIKYLARQLIRGHNKDAESFEGNL